MREVNIGILGLGVVGTALYSIILDKQQIIREKYGIVLHIKKVYVRNKLKKRSANIDFSILTDNVFDIINDRSIDVVCECIGGNGTAETAEYIVSAIKNGKHIVMSSKKALALNLDEIINNIQESGVKFKCDATVAGGIPTQRLVDSVFYGEKISKITGIVNATSNYICSQMQKHQIPFDEALDKAKSLGYAENNPDEDILGYDALYKLVILARLWFNRNIDFSAITVNPITTINITDIAYAHDLGLVIKPIVHIQEEDNNLQCFIGPCLFSEDSIFATVQQNNNIISVTGNSIGNLYFVGQGAGGFPTGAAMFDDLISLLVNNIMQKNVFISKDPKPVVNKEFDTYLRLLFDKTQTTVTEMLELLDQLDLRVMYIKETLSIYEVVLVTKKGNYHTFMSKLEQFGINKFKLASSYPIAETCVDNIHTRSSDMCLITSS